MTVWRQSWPPWRAAPSAPSWPPACSSALPRPSCGWGLPPRCSPAGRCYWPGSSPSSISWVSSLLPPGCMIPWGWCSRISPLPSTPSYRLNGCAPFWNSRFRRERRISAPTATTSPLTMSPLPTGRVQGCWRM